MTAPISEPLVSGRAFRGILRTLKDHCDTETFRKILAGSGAPHVFDQPIRSFGWYPYDVYRGLLIAADQLAGTGTGAFCRTLGIKAGRRDASTVLRIYVALSSPERLIRSCSKVWPSYYANAGHMEALSWDSAETTLRIHGFRAMHPFHCRLMEGWMISTMDMIGLQVNADAHESQCMSGGAPFHEFTCTWRKKR